VAEKPKDQKASGIGVSKKAMDTSSKANSLGSGSVKKFEAPEKLKKMIEKDKKPDFKLKSFHQTRKLAVVKYAVKKRYTVSQKPQETAIEPPVAKTKTQANTDNRTRYVNFSLKNKKHDIKPQKTALVSEENKISETFQQQNIALTAVQNTLDKPEIQPTPSGREKILRNVFRLKQVKNTKEREVKRSRSYHTRALNAARAFAAEASLAVGKISEAADPDKKVRNENLGDEIGHKAQEYTQFSYTAANRLLDIAASDVKKQVEEEVTKLFTFKPKGTETASYRPPVDSKLKDLTLKSEPAAFSKQATTNAIQKEATKKLAKETGKQATAKVSQRAAQKAAKQAAKKAAKKAAQQAAVRRAAASAAAKTSAKTAVATAGGAATGGVLTVVMIAYEAVRWFAKPKNSAMFIMVVLMFLLLPIIAIFMMLSAALYPFNTIVTFIEDAFGNKIEQVEEVDMPGQSIEYYLNIEKKVVEDEQAAIDEAKIYDDSSIPEDAIVPDEHGNYNLTEAQKAEFVASGTIPYFAPVFEGIRWKGTPPPEPFKSQWNSEEGKTDAEALEPPEELYMQMLSTLSSDRQFLDEDEMTEYIPPEECEAFFNSLPFWEWSSWQETYYCEGCVHIEWTETVTRTVSHTNRDTGEIIVTTYTEEVPYEINFCPGHIFIVMDIQLDTDEFENIPDEYYSMDRVWDKLWGTPLEGESEEDAKKRREDGVKAYKEILKQMEKDLKDYEKTKT
jgi:hypothetical protein